MQTLIGLAAFVICTTFISAFTSTAAQAGCEELQAAVASNDYAVINQEIRKATSIDCIGPDGDAPLHVAIYELNADMVAYLLKQGAYVNTRNDVGTTPLSIVNSGYSFIEEDDLPVLANIETILTNAGGAQ